MGKSQVDRFTCDYCGKTEDVAPVNVLPPPPPRWLVIGPYWTCDAARSASGGYPIWCVECAEKAGKELP